MAEKELVMLANAIFENRYVYILFAGREIGIGKNSARGLEYLLVIFFLDGIALKATVLC